MIFRAALAQIDSTPGDIDSNLAVHLQMLENARENDVDLAIFPELSLCGVDLRGYLPAASVTLDGRIISALLAESHHLDIVVGFVEDSNDGNYYNTLAYLSKGRIVHRHRKVYLVSAEPVNERGVFTEGNAMGAFSTRFGKMVLINCEDAWHVGPAYIGMLDGAEIILTCAATPNGDASQLPSADLWKTINSAYSILFEAYNLFVSRVGVEGDLVFCGSSHVIDPRGEVIAEAGRVEPSLTVVTLDTDIVHAQRREVSYVRDERLGLTARAVNQRLKYPN